MSVLPRSLTFIPFIAHIAPPTPHNAPPRVRTDRFGPVQLIAAEEAARAGITYAQIVGGQRSQRFVVPRHIAMWRASRETAASLPAIARVFGNRNHTTVIHALRKIDALQVNKGTSK